MSRRRRCRRRPRSDKTHFSFVDFSTVKHRPRIKYTYIFIPVLVHSCVYGKSLTIGYKSLSELDTSTRVGTYTHRGIYSYMYIIIYNTQRISFFYIYIYISIYVNSMCVCVRVLFLSVGTTDVGETHQSVDASKSRKREN